MVPHSVGAGSMSMPSCACVSAYLVLDLGARHAGIGHGHDGWPHHLPHTAQVSRPSLPPYVGLEACTSRRMDAVAVWRTLFSKLCHPTLALPKLTLFLAMSTLIITLLSRHPDRYRYLHHPPIHINEEEEEDPGQGRQQGWTQATVSSDQSRGPAWLLPAYLSLLPCAYSAPSLRTTKGELGELADVSGARPPASSTSLSSTHTPHHSVSRLHACPQHSAASDGT